jgi:hypothetical protein
MGILTYKVVKYPNEYEAVCEQYPWITWISDSKEEALEGVQEEVFNYLLENRCQFGIAKNVF